MDEAVVLVPEMWAASPALARTAALAWACALGQRGAAAEGQSLTDAWSPPHQFGKRCVRSA